MRRLFQYVILILSLAFGSTSFGQVNLYHALYQSSRVAVLPFLNLSGVPEAALPIMESIHSTIARSTPDVADDSLVHAVLRENRIRNASELAVSDMQLLANTLSVRFLLVGTIDRFAFADSTAEIALSARLIDASTAEAVWAKSTAYSRDPHARLFALGASADTTVTIRRAVSKLMHGFRYERSTRTPQVEAIRLETKNSRTISPLRLMVVTFANETTTPFAGNIVANQIFSAITNAGFATVEPGRVREIMLASQELLQGEMSANLLAVSTDGLGADFVLTGEVTEYISVRQDIISEPRVTFHVRLIDSRDGSIAWARTYSRTGGAASFPQSLFATRGLAELSNHLAKSVAQDLHALRVDTTTLTN